MPLFMTCYSDCKNQNSTSFLFELQGTKFLSNVQLETGTSYIRAM